MAIILNDCHSCGYCASIHGSEHVCCTFNWGLLPGPWATPVLSFHGWERAWCNFPLNYDPVWLKSKCHAYTVRGEEQASLSATIPVIHEIAAALRDNMIHAVFLAKAMNLSYDKAEESLLNVNEIEANAYLDAHPEIREQITSGK